MNYFLCKLIPPRPSFALDMSDEERAIMQAHVVYWRSYLEKGSVILFGPVADPQGAWGMGVVQMKDAATVESFGGNDPAVLSGKGFRFEFYPMPNAIYRK